MSATITLKTIKPKQKLKAIIKPQGNLAIIIVENNNAIAVVPLQEVCKIAERFNLRLLNYTCN